MENLVQEAYRTRVERLKNQYCQADQSKTLRALILEALFSSRFCLYQFDQFLESLELAQQIGHGLSPQVKNLRTIASGVPVSQVPTDLGTWKPEHREAFEAIQEINEATRLALEASATDLERLAPKLDMFQRVFLLAITRQVEATLVKLLSLDDSRFAFKAVDELLDFIVSQCLGPLSLLKDGAERLQRLLAARKVEVKNANEFLGRIEAYNTATQHWCFAAQFAMAALQDLDKPVVIDVDEVFRVTTEKREDFGNEGLKEARSVLAIEGEP